MIALNNLIYILNFVLAIVISYFAINNWLKEKYNHEDMFLWGMSFLLISLKFMLLLLDSYFHINFLIYITSLLDVFIISSHIQCISFNYFPCDKGCVNCKKCYRKYARLISWILSIFIVIVLSVFILMFENDIPIFNNLNMIVVIEIYIIILLLILSTIVPKSFKLLNIAYDILIVSKIIKIFNIVNFNYENNILISVEFIIMTVTLLLIIYSIRKSIIK